MKLTENEEILVKILRHFTELNVDKHLLVYEIERITKDADTLNKNSMEDMGTIRMFEALALSALLSNDKDE